MASNTEWNTARKLPFWLRRKDVAVGGQAAAQQHVEFNWWLVLAPLYALGAGLSVSMLALVACGLVGLSVSLVKTFPVLTAVALIVLLFARR